jgi:hypothetical protein
MPRDPLSLVDSAEDGLEVNDWRPVDRFQSADMHAHAVNAEDAYPMQTDRIGPTRCASAEDALLWAVQVSPWVDSQYAAISLVQPAQHDDLVSDGDAVKSRPDLWVQDQIGVRSFFITLARRVGRRAQRTLYPSYWAECEVNGGVVGHEAL